MFGPLVVFAIETGLRTSEWVALERHDVDRSGPAVLVQRRYADGVLTPYPKTIGSRRRVPLTARALDALDRLPPRLDTKLVFPAARGGYIGLDGWRTRQWYPALDAAGIERRGPISSTTRSPPRRSPRGLDLRAGPGNGHQREDDRPHLRSPGAGLRGGDP